VLSITVSTTMISYIGIFPTLWRLRRKYPDVPRPFRAPAGPFISAFLTLLMIFASIELIAPGLGDSWFGPGFSVAGWQGERVAYMLSQLIPLVIFVAIGVGFWLAGSRTRRANADAHPEAQPSLHSLAAD
jgi:glutamate:GABA antiporter